MENSAHWVYGIARSACSGAASVASRFPISVKWRQVVKVIFIALAIVALARASLADSLENLSALTAAVKEMCIAPDRSGQYFSVEGGGSAGVIIKLVDINGQFKISQQEWDGIKDEISDRPDTRECVKFLVPILADKIFTKSSELDLSGKILYSCRFDRTLQASFYADGQFAGVQSIDGFFPPNLDEMIGEFFITLDGLFFMKDINGDFFDVTGDEPVVHTRHSDRFNCLNDMGEIPDVKWETLVEQFQGMAEIKTMQSQMCIDYSGFFSGKARIDVLIVKKRETHLLEADIPIARCQRA
jgi:hypothetical protein